MSTKALAALLKQKRTLLQLLLGQVQMIGAVMGICFLYHTGLSVWTIATVCITGLFTALSLVLKKAKL